MIEALGHPVFYLAFWICVLTPPVAYVAWRLWRIEQLLRDIKFALTLRDDQ